METLANQKKVYEEYGKQSMLNAIFEGRVDSALKGALKKDELYQKKERAVDKIVKRIEVAGLDREQWKVVDEALSACNTQESEYARVAYGLGFKDGVRLTMEIFLDLQI